MRQPIGSVIRAALGSITPIVLEMKSVHRESAYLAASSRQVRYLGRAKFILFLKNKITTQGFAATEVDHV
jgi:hypothetical protein